VKIVIDIADEEVAKVILLRGRAGAGMVIMPDEQRAYDAPYWGSCRVIEEEIPSARLIGHIQAVACPLCEAPAGRACYFFLGGRPDQRTQEVPHQSRFEEALLQMPDGLDGVREARAITPRFTRLRQDIEAAREEDEGYEKYGSQDDGSDPGGGGY
jgi:hypothetical protein